MTVAEQRNGATKWIALGLVAAVLVAAVGQIRQAEETGNVAGAIGSIPDRAVFERTSTTWASSRGVHTHETQYRPDEEPRVGAARHAVALDSLQQVFPVKEDR